MYVSESIAVYCEPYKEQNRVIPMYVFGGVSLVNVTHLAICSLYEVPTHNLVCVARTPRAIPCMGLA